MQEESSVKGQILISFKQAIEGALRGGEVEILLLSVLSELMFAPWTIFKPKVQAREVHKSTYVKRPVCHRLVTRTEISRKTQVCR